MEPSIGQLPPVVLEAQFPTEAALTRSRLVGSTASACTALKRPFRIEPTTRAAHGCQRQASPKEFRCPAQSSSGLHGLQQGVGLAQWALGCATGLVRRLREVGPRGPAVAG